MLQRHNSDIDMMKDLASFMESKASRLVDEFVIWRELRSQREVPQEGRQIGGSEEAIVRGVVNSFRDVIDTIKIKDYPPQTVKSIFTSIFSGIQNLLPNGGNLFQPSTTSTTTSDPISLPEDISTQAGQRTVTNVSQLLLCRDCHTSPSGRTSATCCGTPTTGRSAGRRGAWPVPPP